MLSHADRVERAVRTDPREKYVACCGLYCGSCPMLKAEIADLARELLPGQMPAGLLGVPAARAVHPPGCAEAG